MGRFQAKTTPEQREALARAVVDAGMSMNQALSEAAFGNLPHPKDPAVTLDPFELSKPRAYEIVNDYRNGKLAEEIKGTPELAARLDEMARRVTVLAEKELRKLEQTDRQGETLNVNRLKAVAGIIRTLALSKPPRRKAEPEKLEPETPNPTLIARLAETSSVTATAPVQTEAASDKDSTDAGTDSRFVSAPEPGEHARIRPRSPV